MRKRAHVIGFRHDTLCVKGHITLPELAKETPGGDPLVRLAYASLGQRPLSLENISVQAAFGLLVNRTFRFNQLVWFLAVSTRWP